MNYKFLFLVGSSLEHFAEEKFSRFSTEQRFFQTLDTIKSIRDRVPNAYICLFECSYKPILDEYKEVLEEQVDLFLEAYDDPIMKLIYENLNANPNLFTFGKSLLETRGLLFTLSYLQENQVFTDVRRIFKMSGRYSLNEHFDIQDYESKLLDNYYVAKTFEYPEIENDIMDEIYHNNFYAFVYKSKGSMVTGLWSFDRTLFSETVEALEKSFRYMEKMISCTSGIDIEHSLYYYLDKKKIIRTPNLGLNVIKGMEDAVYPI